MTFQLCRNRDISTLLQQLTAGKEQTFQKMHSRNDRLWNVRVSPRSLTSRFWLTVHAAVHCSNRAPGPCLCGTMTAHLYRASSSPMPASTDKAASPQRMHLADPTCTAAAPLTVWQDLTSMRSCQWRGQIRRAQHTGDHGQSVRKNAPE